MTEQGPISPHIMATINGQTVDRQTVLAWEARRRKSVMRRMGLVATGDTDEDRARVLARKLAMGLAGARRERALELWIGDRVGAFASWIAQGRRKTSVCGLVVEGGSAREFADWFSAAAASVDPTAMLAACPDHLGFGVDAQGRQVVIETTGGSPSATQFLVDYAVLEGLRTPADPSFPIQVAGVARSLEGLVLGGVRHQFRDVEGGFAARLTVEFPASMPDRMIQEHAWHLACEFSNWIELAARARR